MALEHSQVGFISNISYDNSERENNYRSTKNNISSMLNLNDQQLMQLFPTATPAELYFLMGDAVDFHADSDEDSHEIYIESMNDNNNNNNSKSTDDDGLSEDTVSNYFKTGICQDEDLQEICVVCQDEYQRQEILATLNCRQVS